MVRIIFAGHTVLDKRRLVEQIAKECIPHDLPKNLNDTRVMEVIRVVDVEEKILQITGKDHITPILDSFFPRIAEDRWREAFHQILADIDGVKDVFLLMHLTYYRSGRWLSLFDIDALKTFKPDLIITLTDDVFHVWYRILKREERRYTGSYFKLSEILSWRMVELLIADLVAKMLNIRNVYIAAKHPISTFFKLIKTDLPIVYHCHPISRARDAQNIVGEVNDFRKRLEEISVVLEPTTIDEKILENIKNRGYIVEKADRWPIETDIDELYPIELKQAEVEEIITPSPTTHLNYIDHQIRYRDYRYIDQSDMVVAYRPFYGRQLHVGVWSEIHYAILRYKEVLAYVPENERIRHPFVGSLREFSSADDVIEEVKKRRRGWSIRD